MPRRCKEAFGLRAPVRSVERFVERQVLGDRAEECVPPAVTGRIWPLDEEGSPLVVRGVREPPDELEHEPAAPAVIRAVGQVSTKSGEGKGVLGHRLDAQFGDGAGSPDKSFERAPGRRPSSVLVGRDHRLVDSDPPSELGLRKSRIDARLAERSRRGIEPHMHDRTCTSERRGLGQESGIARTSTS